MIDNTQTRRLEGSAFRHLVFAARFAGAKWEECREGDRINFTEDLFLFMHPALDSISKLAPAEKEKWSRSVQPLIPRIQIQLWDDLNALADGLAKFEVKPSDKSSVEMFAFATDRFAPYQQIIMIGNDIDTARAHLQNYLVQSRITPAQIRRCPECQTVFVLKRKPQRPALGSAEIKRYYCSSRCCMKGQPKPSAKARASSPRSGRGKQSPRARRAAAR